MAGSSRSTPSLWPREHGAYAQLGAALAAALVLAPAPRTLAQALLTTALFLASEPLLVLMGRRGEPEPGGRRAAGNRLTLLLALAALGGAAAWAGLPLARLAALVPAGCLALVLFGLFLARREHTAAGELAAAWGFAAAALAAAAAGGSGAARAGALALVLAAILSLAMAIVHLHLLALRRAGAPGPRLAAAGLGLALTVGTWLLGRAGWLPPAAFTALAPMVLAGLGIWLFPPRPRQLKAVGWSAAACALAGGVLAALLVRTW
jgi:hypothetical protein